MTTPGPTPDHRGQQEHKPAAGSGWWYALVAIPILCCAGPVLLAAIGLGSVGALLAAGSGQAIVAVLLALAVLATLAALVLRSRRR